MCIRNTLQWRDPSNKATVDLSRQTADDKAKSNHRHQWVRTARKKPDYSICNLLRTKISPLLDGEEERRNQSKIVIGSSMLYYVSYVGWWNLLFLCLLLNNGVTNFLRMMIHFVRIFQQNYLLVTIHTVLT